MSIGYPVDIILFVLTVEDIKLNTTVFHWPETIKTVFELSHTRIQNRREQVEEEVRKHVAAFEEKLAEYQKEIDSFKKKEVRINLSSV